MSGMIEAQKEHERKQERHKEAVKNILKSLDGFTSSEINNILLTVQYKMDHSTRFRLEDVIGWK